MNNLEGKPYDAVDLRLHELWHETRTETDVSRLEEFAAKANELEDDMGRAATDMSSVKFKNMQEIMSNIGRLYMLSLKKDKKEA